MYPSLEDFKEMMMKEEQEGSVELSAKRKKPKKDKEQTKITSFMPKAAAYAGTTFLELMVGVGLMLLKVRLMFMICCKETLTFKSLPAEI